MAGQLFSGSPQDTSIEQGTIVPVFDWPQDPYSSFAPSRFQPAPDLQVSAPAPREPNPWYAIGTLSLVALHVLLVGGFLAQRARRRRAEQVVRTSQTALRNSYAQIGDLAGRLMTAQEAERTRIARDLHDNACQEVAAIGVDVSQLRHMGGDIQDPYVQQALLSVQSRTVKVAESLRLLSHDLHPGLLQHVGLAAALEAHCAEMERQHHIQVRFFTVGEVEPASPVLTLSLFRIAQEALSNAARHGQAGHVTVSLTRDGDDLTLSVTDDGMGFDVARARQNGGLGLVSIEERARLMKGLVTIRSRLRHGTTIDVRVPLDFEETSGGQNPTLCFVDENAYL
jgi:two-component system sensor histidine kinase UhpB